MDLVNVWMPQGKGAGASVDWSGPSGTWTEEAPEWPQTRASIIFVVLEW